MSRLPVIALTSGEPAGIGPDICLARAHRSLRCRAVILGDRGLLAARASQLGLDVRLREFDAHRWLVPSALHELPQASVTRKALALALSSPPV